MTLTNPEAIPKIPIMENNIGKALAGKAIEKDFDPVNIILNQVEDLANNLKSII